MTTNLSDLITASFDADAIRTDALHEALGRAPIEEDTLLALVVLAFAGQNVSIASGASDNPYGHARSPVLS